jgi:hypothetical protein
MRIFNVIEAFWAIVLNGDERMNSTQKPVRVNCECEIQLSSHAEKWFDGVEVKINR